MNLRLPTYRQTGSALHATRAGVAACYLAAPCLVVVAYDHPLLLVATLAGLVAAGRAAGLRSELARAARLAVPLALLVVLVNPLVSRQGLTVLTSGPTLPVIGRLDVTLEALVYGGVAALRVLVVTLAFAIYSAAVDPDEVLRLFRRLSLRSSLTASLATRLVPVLARDAGRLSDAYELRAARPARADDRWARLRRAAILTRALTAGALERAIEMAAALEVRGYAVASRLHASGERRAWSRHDRAFGVCAVAIALLAVAGSLAGVAGFEPYPSLTAELGGAELALALLLPVLMLAPFGAAALHRSLGRRNRSVAGKGPRLGNAGV